MQEMATTYCVNTACPEYGTPRGRWWHHKDEDGQWRPTLTSNVSLRGTGRCRECLGPTVLEEHLPHPDELAEWMWKREQFVISLVRQGNLTGDQIRDRTNQWVQQSDYYRKVFPEKQEATHA